MTKISCATLRSFSQNNIFHFLHSLLQIYQINLVRDIAKPHFYFFLTLL